MDTSAVGHTSSQVGIRTFSGIAGGIITISAIAFVVLGCMQPEWFTKTIGTIGNPHSWTLWTISGGATIIGGGLITYAIFGGRRAWIEQPVTSDVPEWIHTKEKNSFDRKPLAELFTEEELGAIADYEDAFPTKPEDVKESVMKGCLTFPKLSYIILKLVCVGSPKNEGLIGKHVSKNLPSDMDVDSLTNSQNSEIERCKTQPILLIFSEHQEKWKQRSICEDRERIVMPCFLEDYLGTRKLGDHDSGSNEHMELEEQGFIGLKNLIQGGTAVDHNGLEWKLAP